ncbi:MAG: hypothetical protein V2A76_06130 [Planctomycetota bacterium]
MPILLLENLGLTATFSVLLLGGLLLVFFLLRSRLDLLLSDLARLGKDLGRMGNDLDRLGNDLDQMKDRTEPPPPPPPPPPSVPVDLSPVHAALDEMRQELSGMERHLESMAGDLARERSVHMREMVERRFYGRGYQSIRVVGEIPYGLKEPMRLPVEGTKGGVTYKGFVMIEDGQIVEEKMSSSTEVFP